jgi:hypothetical protein
MAADFMKIRTTALVLLFAKNIDLGLPQEAMAVIPSRKGNAVQLPTQKPATTNLTENRSDQKKSKSVKLRVDSTLPASILGNALESASPYQNPATAPEIKPITRQIQDGEHSVKMDVKF